MKKLIFLLLTAVILNGFVFAAETAHPPWDISLEAVMFSYGVDNCAVILDTVSVTQHDIIILLPADFSVSNSGIQKLTIETHYNTIKPIINTGQTENYWLRL
jgi:hypothetical protein